MEHTKIIILGANGMLGRYISKLYHLNKRCNKHIKEIIEITRQDFDFGQSSEDVFEYLSQLCLENDLIINCIGLTNKRKSATPEEELQFWRINAVLPRLIGQVTQKNKAYAIHITTDCVFDGKEPWMCKMDPHTSIDLYGLTKSMGDKSIGPYRRVALIRCSIIGEEPYNRSLVEWVLNQPDGSEIDGYKNHMWNGVTCLQLAKIIFVAKYTFGDETIFTSAKAVSKYDVVCSIVKHYNLNIKVRETHTAEPLHRQLSQTLATEVSIQQQILEMKQFDVLERRT
jgi:dTDP-4-dehydrorhamnose reductase